MELCPLNKPHKTVTNGFSKSAIQCNFNFFLYIINPIQYVVCTSKYQLKSPLILYKQQK